MASPRLPTGASEPTAVDTGSNKDTSTVDNNSTNPQSNEQKSTNGAKLNSIIVSARQRGNPLLKSIRNVPWEYDEIVPDYVMGKTTCALFLSLRYHNLHPNYIHNRLKDLGTMYELRVVLVLIDSKDPQHALKELAKICLLANCTLILAWSNDEAGRYLETYKSYEHKPPDIIMERAEKNYNAQIIDCLTSVKSVNKTDALTLLSTFGSLEKISKTSVDDLSLCPGFGPQKKQKLFDVFRTPFRKTRPGMSAVPRGISSNPPGMSDVPDDPDVESSPVVGVSKEPEHSELVESSLHVEHAS